MKLAFADREAYFGDPRMVDVPIEAMLSRDYAETTPRDDPPGQGLAGNAAGRRSAQARRRARGAGAPLVPERAFSAPELDTSHVCGIDQHGNVFAATPSDGSYNAPVIPELGIIPSPRGSQNWGDPDHPSGVAPGKRPRLTPSPAIAIQPGKMKMPFGTPGGDVQTQAMLQVFLNIHLFGMELQEAVEAPRVASYSYPSSFEPHAYHPGLLNLESRIDKATGDALGRSVTRSTGGRTGPGSPAPSARSSPTRRAACSRAAPIRAGRPMPSGCKVRDEVPHCEAGMMAGEIALGGTLGSSESLRAAGASRRRRTTRRGRSGSSRRSRPVAPTTCWRARSGSSLATAWERRS